MLTEKQHDRLILVHHGWIRKLKWEMIAEFEKNRTVTVNSDQPKRMEAAEKLIESGMAVEVDRRESRAKRGPMPASGQRRMRTILTIAAPVKPAAEDDARI